MYQKLNCLLSVAVVVVCWIVQQTNKHVVPPSYKPHSHHVLVYRASLSPIVVDIHSLAFTFIHLHFCFRLCIVYFDRL